MKRYTIILGFLLVACSCDQPRTNFDQGIVPLEVVNFTEINSRYDDYNSAGPMMFSEDHFTLVFSSKRNRLGADFDLVSYHCLADLNNETGHFGFYTDPQGWPLLDSINTTANEYGPYIAIELTDYWLNGGAEGEEKTFYYASDETGDLDILFWNYKLENGLEIMDSGRVNGLNSPYDEGYLCHYNGASSMGETVYFTSDRDGDFDIFMATGDSAKITTSVNFDIIKLDILSGPFDDKCPYIVNDLLVFTSDREGGYGGFDLWYSSWNGSAWSAPVNFGEQINSEYNEYRPIIVPSSEGPLLNDILIFSSDRPGGAGGYDLYYTGMKRPKDYF